MYILIPNIITIYNSITVTYGVDVHGVYVSDLTEIIVML